MVIEALNGLTLILKPLTLENLYSILSDNKRRNNSDAVNESSVVKSLYHQWLMSSIKIHMNSPDENEMKQNNSKFEVKDLIIL